MLGTERRRAVTFASTMPRISTYPSSGWVVLCLAWKNLGESSARRRWSVKVKASVKRVCGACQIVRRKGKVRVICKSDPKHKQVQG